MPSFNLPWKNLMRFLPIHQRVGHKIIAGYGLSLSLAIAGTVIGVGLGSRYQEKVWQHVTTVQLENRLIHRFKDRSNQLRVQNYSLLKHTDDAAELQQQIGALILAERELALLWSDVQIFTVNHPETAAQYGQMTRSHLIKSNSYAVSRYFYELRVLERSLRSASESTPETRRAAVIAFLNSSTAKDFDNLVLMLVQQTQEAMAEVVRAEQDLRVANQANAMLVLASMSASVLAAAIIGWLVSRSISRSLGAVERVADAAAASGDFSQRCRVITQDEIGSVAHSLNQLIEWVAEHTQVLEANRDQLETMVAARTQELRAVIDYLGDALLVCDGATGQITRCNPAFTKMFGLNAYDVVGQLPEAVLAQDLVQLIAEHRRDPHPISATVALANDRLGQALISPILAEVSGAELRLDGAVILIRDVTEARAIEQMKTDFLSTVSHELRTPLTSVIGFTKLILKKFEDSLFPALPTDDRKTTKAVRQVRDNLHIIISEGERLTALINDVLDIAKIEAGKVEWHMNPIAIQEIVKQAVGATSVLAQNSGLQVNVDVSEDLPLVLVDRDRIVQVLINLLSNAIKFTDQGAVTCQVERVDQMLLVRVIDTGMGLAQGDLALVFEKFKQVGEVMTNKPKGTGLGLPICKQIIEHHGGKIWAESVLGEGSTFCFTVPIVVKPLALELVAPPTYPITQQPNAKPLFNQLVQQMDSASAPNPPSVAGRTILVVDDEPSIRQLLRQELESQDYHVQEAADGIQALDAVRRHPPDLIILDIMMPKMNGLDLAAILKNNPETAMIPIIMLSIMEEQERGYRLGVDRYQSKPLNIGVLFQDIALLLEQGAANPRMLTVDGEINTINALMAVLLERGYMPISVWHGQVGLDMAMANQQHMVIIDSGITGMDVEPHDPGVKTFRLDNGESSIFFVLRSQMGIDLPEIGAIALVDMGTGVSAVAQVADSVSE
jgi:PAS domain S-box-containing protein